MAREGLMDDCGYNFDIDEESYNSGFKDGFLKAVDEFAEKLIATFCYEPPVKQKIQLDNVYDGESIREIITEVAEQLKEE